MAQSHKEGISVKSTKLLRKNNNHEYVWKTFIIGRVGSTLWFGLVSQRHALISKCLRSQLVGEESANEASAGDSNLAMQLHHSLCCYARLP